MDSSRGVLVFRTSDAKALRYRSNWFQGILPAAISLFLTSFVPQHLSILSLRRIEATRERSRAENRKIARQQERTSRERRKEGRKCWRGGRERAKGKDEHSTRSPHLFSILFIPLYSVCFLSRCCRRCCSSSREESQPQYRETGLHGWIKTFSGILSGYFIQKLGEGDRYCGIPETIANRSPDVSGSRQADEGALAPLFFKELRFFRFALLSRSRSITNVLPRGVIRSAVT